MMIINAMEKIKVEMKQYKGESSIQKIGDFLLEQLSNSSEVAEKILDPEKSIVKSLENMQKEVEKTIEQSKRKGKVVKIMTDEEGFALVLKYYGIEEKTENENCNVFDMLKDFLK